MLSIIGSVAIMGDLFSPLIAPMATSHRINALASDFGCTVEVYIGVFKHCCNLRNLLIELSKTFTLAPSPIAVLAANSPTVPAPRMTTLVGGTPPIFPKVIHFLYLHHSSIRQQLKQKQFLQSHSVILQLDRFLLHL